MFANADYKKQLLTLKVEAEEHFFLQEIRLKAEEKVLKNTADATVHPDRKQASKNYS